MTTAAGQAQTAPPKSEAYPASWGVALGLAFAVGFSLLRTANSGPPRLLEEAAGNAAFSLLLAGPHLLALASLKTSDAARGPLLLAASVLSLLSLGTSLAGVGIVFLPSAVLYAIAAVRVLRRSGVRGGLVPVLALGSLASAALAPYSFLQLFSGPDEQRCWDRTTYADGRTEWRVSEDVNSSPNILSGPPQDQPAPGVVSEGGMCTSDIVTNAEGVRSLAAWSLGAGGLAVVWLAGLAFRPRPPVGQPYHL
jgi:hypothetical protein